MPKVLVAQTFTKHTYFLYIKRVKEILPQPPKMRIFFLALFVILGANLGIELLDSNMTQIIRERNESIQRSMNNL